MSLWRNVAQRGNEEDEINTDGTILDLHVTNLFLIMCGQDAIIELRSPMSLENVIDTQYRDIRLAIKSFVPPKERVVTAENVN